MVQTLVQNNHRYLLLRGNTYYFRYVLPQHVRQLCPSLPREIKRSLGTDSFAAALNFISRKMSLISLIKRSRDAGQLKLLCERLRDFSGVFKEFVDQYMPRVVGRREGSHMASQVELKASTPKMSTAWKGFVNWKNWSPKALKNNKLLFDNILHFLGDVPVGVVTRRSLTEVLASISKLPQRNKRRYKGVPLKRLSSMQISDEDRISSKTVKEHLKLCQGFFNTYLVKEKVILDRSPTEGIRLDHEDNRFASLGDAQVIEILKKSLGKPEWFRWMLLLAAYSGARRSELARLRSEDFRTCPDTGRNYFVVHFGKTKAARRVVPVHHELVEKGFLKWVERRDGVIFSVAYTNPNRVTDMFSSLVDVRVNDLGERIVFHSLRHTFITKARSVGVEAVLVQQVVGHEKSGAGLTDRYTHTFPLKAVLSVVDSIDYGLGGPR